MRSRVEGMWWGTAMEASDPGALAGFYSRLLDRPIVHEEPGTSVVAVTEATYLVFQAAEGYVPPVWPPAAGQQRTMMHFDFQVGHLDSAVADAVGLGATLADHQPQDNVRVLLDPDGHPFCLCVETDGVTPEEVLPLDDVFPGTWLVPHLSGTGLVRDVVPASYAAHVRVPESEERIGVGDESAKSLWSLRDVLARHTRTPERCWFTFWVGFTLPRRWQRAAQLRLPHREHLLFAGGLDDLETISEAFGSVGYSDPNLWWPEDRAWVAHWEVDSDAVYVAGSEDLAGDLLAAGLGALTVSPDGRITIER